MRVAAPRKNGLVSTVLKTLNLAVCGITNTGAIAIADPLKVNASMTTLRCALTIP